MSTVLVLGAGMVGSVMALDMAQAGWQVTVADARPDALSRVSEKCLAAGASIKTVQADLSIPSVVTRLAGEHELVLGALSSVIAHKALGAVIEAGRPYCDISFMAEDATSLHERAQAMGVCCVVDCGVAPGMSHILCMHGSRMLETCERVEIYVGGLPRERSWPYQYKAAFAPSDVIEEYTRPVRLVRDGKEMIVEALSEPELMDFAGIGTLEAFNTDGLRSLVTTLAGRVPTMVEKTLRYPGHIELMRVLRATGLMGTEPIEINGVHVSPREVLAKLMFPMWTYAPGEEDLTVMRVIATGTRGGRQARLSWDLLDLYHLPSQCTSMARTTALPCASVGRMLAAGLFKEPGVHPPERIAQQPGLVERLLQEQEERGVIYQFREA